MLDPGSDETTALLNVGNCVLTQQHRITSQNLQHSWSNHGNSGFSILQPAITSKHFLKCLAWIFICVSVWECSVVFAFSVTPALE
jgi:hypothetical protein